MSPQRIVITSDDLARAVHDASPSTPDDVCITLDGRRLDTREKLLSFLDEITQTPGPAVDNLELG